MLATFFTSAETRVDAAAGGIAIGAGPDASIASSTFSSLKPLIAPPFGKDALVPVIKKPASVTKAIAPTTPAVPVTPLSSNAPVSRTWRPFALEKRSRALSFPDLPHIPLLRTSVISP